MSTVLFSKTFVKKLTLSYADFGGQEYRKKPPLALLRFQSWEDICQPKKMEDSTIGTYKLSTKAWLFMQLGILQLTKILSFLQFSKLNISPMQVSGLLLTRDLGPPFGLLLCRSNLNFATTLFTRFMQGIVQFGPLLGAQSGEIFITILFYQWLMLPCLVWCLISGLQTPTRGTLIYYLKSLITMLYRLFRRWRPYVATNLTLSDGHRLKKVIAPLRIFTGN